MDSGLTCDLYHFDYDSQQWVKSLSGPDYTESSINTVKHFVKDFSTDLPSPQQFYNAFEVCDACVSLGCRVAHTDLSICQIPATFNVLSGLPHVLPPKILFCPLSLALPPILPPHTGQVRHWTIISICKRNGRLVSPRCVSRHDVDWV